jgi:hypothetical protein
LRIEPEAGLALTVGRDAIVGDEALHRLKFQREAQGVAELKGRRWGNTLLIPSRTWRPTIKTTIDDQTYDTDRADVIAQWSNGLPEANFTQAAETLYQDRESGNYFLLGEDGPTTRWSTSHGNMRSRGRKIVALRPDEALEWAKTHMLWAGYERAFGVVTEHF